MEYLTAFAAGQTQRVQARVRKRIFDHKTGWKSRLREKRENWPGGEVGSLLVGNPPATQPTQMSPLLARTFDTEHDDPKVCEQPNDNGIENDMYRPIDLIVSIPGKPVRTKSKRQDGVIKSRVVMMDVCHACHNNEGDVMEHPSNGRVYPRIMDVVDFTLRQVIVSTLPPHEIPEDQ